MDEKAFLQDETKKMNDDPPVTAEEGTVMAEETTGYKVPTRPILQPHEPINVQPSPPPMAVMASADRADGKKQGFFAKNKGLIATGVICSLLGGAIGGAVSATMLGGNNQNNGISSIPNGTAPIQIIGDENISPVVAIAQAVSPTVVGITNKATVRNFFGQVGEAAQGSGSGVVFREDGYIITNYHVIEGATSLSVSLADGRTVDGYVVGSDADTDLAVVKIEADNLHAAVLGDSDQLQVGELAVAIGNPLGNDFARTVTDGIISGTDRTIQAEDRTYQVLQTNAAINSGNSGGPLVNSKGEVIGINSVKVQSSGVEGMGFAIPINEVKPIVEELMANGYVSRPYMGITGITLDKQLIQRYQLTPQVGEGVLVYSIIAGSPAQKAGLQAGDVIYKVDETILQTMEQLTDYLAEHKAGDKLTFLVDRGGKQLSVALTLGDQGTVQQQPMQPQSSNRDVYTMPW